MNYWYVARANELFIDTDNASRSIKHSRARLQGAIECGKLDVAYVMSRPSKSKDHIHTIITLRESMNPILRSVWEIILHGDIYRGCCGIMRVSCGSFLERNNCDILISPFELFECQPKYFSGDWKRYHDDFCECSTKHNAETMKTCPAAIRLRGENRTRGFFGKPSKNPCTIWPE